MIASKDAVKHQLVLYSATLPLTSTNSLLR